MVVTLGDHARDGRLRALGESSELPLVPTLWAPHPSFWGLGGQDRPREPQLHAVLDRVREIITEPQPMAEPR